MGIYLRRNNWTAFLKQRVNATFTTFVLKFFRFFALEWAVYLFIFASFDDRVPLEFIDETDLICFSLSWGKTGVGYLAQEIARSILVERKRKKNLKLIDRM